MCFLATAFFSFGFYSSALAGITFEKSVNVVPCEAGQNVVTATIPFRVTGGKPLSVTQIRSSCNCTTGEADAPEYAPGSSGQIKVVFTVGERTGLQRKTFTVKTSDGKEQVFFFQTTVPVILEMKPAFVFWRKGDKPDAKTVTLNIRHSQPVQVIGAEAASPENFTVELLPVSAGKTYTLRITPKSTATPVTSRIVLKTDFPKDDVERFVVVAAVK